MRKLILPALLAISGLAAGAGAGWVLRAKEDAISASQESSPKTAVLTEFVKLNNQFVIPVVADARVASLVIMSLNVEVDLGSSELVYTREPKLRDALLQVMFDHANAGGFQGVFTESANLVSLRKALLEAALSILGPVAKDILISDISRQDA